MDEDLNPNIDPRIRYKALPAAAVNKGFVRNEVDSNYEKYLLELLNATNYFIKKGGGIYYSPKNENNGQCDAIAENYELDFKLLDASTRLQSSNLFSLRITNHGNGMTSFGKCKNEDGEIKATNIHVAFRSRNLSDLIQVKTDFQNERKQCIETDIVKVLNVVETKKNLLLFYPFKFIIKNQDEVDDLEEAIFEALNFDFGSLFEYRNKMTTGFDTYFSTMIEDTFYIFEVKLDSLHLVETVQKDSLPTFVKLHDYYAPYWQ